MKHKILNILKTNNGHISGETISERLGISRSAVWKYINKLKEEGYIIDSVTNKGYKLVGLPDILSSEEIKDGLATSFVGQTVYFFPETDSTNNCAKAQANSADGSLFITEKQNSGKGRLGKSWSSPYGTGIWMSILLKPDILPSQVPKLTLVAGLAVCNALKKSDINAQIKWPNDIVINGKKVCGILTEMSAEIEKVNFVICGIGVNVNTENFPNDISQTATSIFIETKQKQNRKKILQDILYEFEDMYLIFLNQGIASLLPAYKENCVTLNKIVSVIFRDKTITAEAIDIDEDGSLIIFHNGSRLAVNSGEVSVRGIYGYA
ncbi:MAG: biotin--[acetyl-CoA-carboxylase] ligase [Clostridia bacterium]|nr:biotin--[acetyl-CoA-carboxylase] ligase [Clostridia bacterium]